MFKIMKENICIIQVCQSEGIVEADEDLCEEEEVSPGGCLLSIKLMAV